MRVLIVEDEPLEARLIAKILTSHGYETVIAGCLSTARIALDHGGFDAAVIDVHLPNGDGRHLVEENPSLPVVLVSGCPDGDNVIDKLELIVGASRFREFLEKHIEFARRKLGIA